jgi:RND family efflux transporter MFP subunit
MLRPSLTLLTLGLCLSLVACNKGEKGAEAGKDKKAAADKAAAVVLKISPVDVITLQKSELTSGPVITGSIQPERKADLRAEVSSVVLQVLKENGDVVKKGEVLVRLDETSIRDNVNSAEDNARGAAAALDQAERALQRLKTLRNAGMTSAQSLDDAEVRRNAAEGEASASKARVVAAKQQLQRTLVRAPFDGVISDKKVSAGDTAAIGKELLKVIDPTSMRFEGRVSADKISVVKAGQNVNFRVNGYNNQEFHGKVKRVDPVANDVTRQVEVLVSFNDANQPRVAGLYGEGNIDAASAATLLVPESALVKAGDKAYVWQVKGKVLHKAELDLGVRDARNGMYEVVKGLAENDMILRHPSSSFKEGQSIEMSVPPAASVAVGTPSKSLK